MFFFVNLNLFFGFDDAKVRKKCSYFQIFFGFFCIFTKKLIKIMVFFRKMRTFAVFISEKTRK